jgi:hypothetical protein
MPEFQHLTTQDVAFVIREKSSDTGEDLVRFEDVNGNKLSSIPRSGLALNTQVTSYTLVLADANKVVGINRASSVNLTIPSNDAAAFPIGTYIGIRQAGAGQITVTASVGVTLNSRGAVFKLAGQYAHAGIRKVAINTWELAGDITA